MRQHPHGLPRGQKNLPTLRECFGVNMPVTFDIKRAKKLRDDYDARKAILKKVQKG